MKLWIVGRINAKNHREWTFEGAFSSKEKAERACWDWRCFVGPARLDARLPRRRFLWPRSYYPIIRGKAK